MTTTQSTTAPSKPKLEQTIKRVSFHGKQDMQLEYSEPKALASQEVRVSGNISMMSIGTENIVYNRLFEEGSHWANWTKYPFYPGYALVGVITECADDVDQFKPGQRVATRAGHANEHVRDVDQCMLIPDGISDEEAVWFALAKITFAGARAAQYTLGHNTLIVGGGPIGQLSARWALACGSSKVCLVDPLPLRQDIAQQGGVHHVIGKSLNEAFEEITDVFGGMPQTVVDSTGIAPVFADCLRICADHGRVVIMGDTGTPSEQYLTGDVVKRGLHITGAHDCHQSNIEGSNLFWQFVKDGRISLEGMNTHRFALSDAQAAYDLVNSQRGQSMGVLFDLQS